MPYKRRGSKERDTRITGAAVSLYERGKRLIARGDEDGLRDVSFQLAIELKLKPRNECPLDCDEGTPPDYMDTDAEIADYIRSRAIRLELEQALRARRRGSARGAPGRTKAAEAAPVLS